MTTQTTATDLSNANPATPVVVPPAVPTPLQDTVTAIKVGELLSALSFMTSALIGALIVSVWFFMNQLIDKRLNVEEMLSFSFAAGIVCLMLLEVHKSAARVMLGAWTYALIIAAIGYSSNNLPEVFNILGLGLTVGAFLSNIFIQAYLEDEVNQPPSAN